ncbi:hypothetical protein FPOAC1_008899 [Fusarium poae]|uniref:hypothetical protein n=1 Tax=Fusarium poae TaxID=36050 RepID=UPI001CEB2A52|nr:hypothetical protein FPOAC1_008899 [Fusarium poae]KAG8669504.1 hypothetical protein FPOAC1_008899 [Fusarium poae]
MFKVYQVANDELKLILKIQEKVRDLKVDVRFDGSSKRTNAIEKSTESNGSQIESLQKRAFHEQVKNHRSSSSQHKSKSKVPKSAKYLFPRKWDSKDDTLVLQLRKKCEALQKARRKLEKEKHDAQYVVSRLRRKIEKKQKKLSKERLISEGKDLEIDLLREDINALEQELKSRRGDSDGFSEDCQEIGSNLQFCVESTAMRSPQDLGRATPKVSNGGYKTDDLWSQGYGTTADSFWDGAKTSSSIKSDPFQRAYDAISLASDRADRNDLLSIKSNTTRRTSRRTTGSEAQIDPIKSGSRMDNSGNDNMASGRRRRRRRLRNGKRVNSDIGAPEHWLGESFDWGDAGLL